MREKKKVLILYFNQFGYHIDSYMYAKYADKEKIELHYFCFDNNLEKIIVQGVIVKYIPLLPDRIMSYLTFFLGLKKYILKEKFDLIFHIDAKFTLLIRVMNLFCPMILDIRSGDLSDNRFKLWLRNKQMTISSWFYKKVSVISVSLAKELKINPKKLTIIPLGGELHSFAPKKFDAIKMLYIGSLNNRNIEQTITGFTYFRMEHPECDISYDIVGFGNTKIENDLRRTIENSGMGNFIRLHGRKAHPELASFLELCNLGIVYVPQKRYYDFQPSTKLFEYALAGMAIIVTDTYENRLALKNGCGVICKDNAESFAQKLKTIYEIRQSFNSDDIKNQYLSSSWDSIVQKIWMPYILSA